jgi:hypothetical protein
LIVVLRKVRRRVLGRGRRGIIKKDGGSSERKLKEGDLILRVALALGAKSTRKYPVYYLIINIPGIYRFRALSAYSYKDLNK